MFCPKCGKQIPDGAAFCPGCGTKLAPVSPVSPVSPATPVNVPPVPVPRRRNKLPILLAGAALVLVGVLAGVLLSRGGGKKDAGGQAAEAAQENVQTAAEAEDASGPIANIDYGGNVCRVGSKLILMEETEEGNVAVRDMQEPDGSARSVPVNCNGYIVGFQGAAYCVTYGDLDYSLVRIDPDSLETEAVYQIPEVVNNLWYCGRIGEIPYFWAAEDPGYFVLFHIDENGQVTEDSRVDIEAKESFVNLAESLGDDVHFDFYSLRVCQDGLLIPTSDGRLYLFDFSLDLIKQFSYPDLPVSYFARQIGDYYYCVGNAAEGTLGQNFFRIARDGSGYEDLSGPLTAAGADMTRPVAYDYGPGCVYAAFCGENGLVDLYRLDTETLQARLLSTFQAQLPEGSGDGRLYIYMYMLGDSGCLISLQSISSEGFLLGVTGWQHFTFTP